MLRTGSGRTILLRTDMDASTAKEQTELPYASKARATDEDGIENPVMHACGHDMHVSCLMSHGRYSTTELGKERMERDSDIPSST